MAIEPEDLNKLADALDQEELGQAAETVREAAVEIKRLREEIQAIEEEAWHANAERDLLD